MKFYNAYACECWTLTERNEARLDAFNMRCQRKILQVVWSQHTNSSVRLGIAGLVQWFGLPLEVKVPGSIPGWTTLGNLRINLCSLQFLNFIGSI